MNQTELNGRIIELYIESLDDTHRVLLEYCHLAIEIVVSQIESNTYKVETCLNINCPSTFGRDALFLLGAGYYAEKATMLGIQKIVFGSLEEYEMWEWCRQPENKVY